MLALINRIFDWIKSKFWSEEMELTLVGLQCSGKTTFVHVIAVSKTVSYSYCVHVVGVTRRLYFVQYSYQRMMPTAVCINWTFRKYRYCWFLFVVSLIVFSYYDDVVTS